MPSTTPRIHSMDALFGLSDHVLPKPVADFAFLPTDKIRYFRKHPFRLYTGERLNDLVQSVRAHGVLVPVIVRRIEPDENGCEYEMLAGHNRHNSAVLAGLSTIPSVIKENLSDKDAWGYVIETNVFQRSFKEMLPSEKAAVLALHYSEMFSQGKRNDILRELEQLEMTANQSSSATCGNDFHKLCSRDELGAEYSLTGRSIANYIRLDRLSTDLKLRLDDGDFTITGGVHLSYLTAEQQGLLESVIKAQTIKITDAKAKVLREYATTQTLTKENIHSALFSGAKPSASVSVRLPQVTYQKYFKPGISKHEIETTIDKALALYFASKPTGKEVMT